MKTAAIIILLILAGLAWCVRRVWVSLRTGGWYEP